MSTLIRSLDELIKSKKSLPEALHQIEETLVSQAIQKARGQRAEAARILGINRTTLVMKLRKFPDIASMVWQ